MRMRISTLILQAMLKRRLCPMPVKEHRTEATSHRGITTLSWISMRHTITCTGTHTHIHTTCMHTCQALVKHLNALQFTQGTEVILYEVCSGSWVMSAHVILRNPKQEDRRSVRRGPILVFKFFRIGAPKNLKSTNGTL
jgi:hypothetical protein